MLRGGVPCLQLSLHGNVFQGDMGGYSFSIHRHADSRLHIPRAFRPLSVAEDRFLGISRRSVPDVIANAGLWREYIHLIDRNTDLRIKAPNSWRHLRNSMEDDNPKMTYGGLG